MSHVTPSHCSCCHSCHVSMKQRPRPLLACSECTNIYCSVCLSSRFKTDKWAEWNAQTDKASALWTCPKCAGDCVCKSCSKLRPGTAAVAASVSRKRELADSMAPEVEEEEAVAALFSAPPRHRKAQAVEDPLANHQPMLPAGFQPTQKTSILIVPQERALGMLHFDASTPVHRKALELARQKQHVDVTIKNMQNLLTMLEQERTVLDAALNGLIKQTTSQVGLARTASVAQFEELCLSPKMRKSPSQCNMEALAPTLL